VERRWNELSKEAADRLRLVMQEEMNRRVLRDPDLERRVHESLERDNVSPIQMFFKAYFGRFLTDKELESGVME